MLIVIKGAGDLASGVAVRLHRAGHRVVMTDLPVPTAIRRTVSFCPALVAGSAQVEGIVGRRAAEAADIWRIINAGEIPVLADPEAHCIRALKPDVVVDAIIAKRNTGTGLTDAPIVIALGPGFTGGVDCHAAIETMRGHDFGRVCYAGGTTENTGVPGLIGGYAEERVMHAPCAGEFHAVRQIGDMIEAGETVAYVGGMEVQSDISGILRGVLSSGIVAPKGMKCADVDPRCKREHCFSVSDKARGLGGAVLEAIGYLHAAARGTVIEAAQLRRQDKSLEEKAAIVSILDECKVCRLGIAEAGESAYVVPLNFGYTWPQDGALSLYFHGAKTGKKMSLLRRCPVVAFEMDCGHTLKPAEEACGYGYAFRSLMGEGQVVFLEDAGQKAEGLSALMLRQTGRRFDFDAAATENVAVYRLDVHRISAKEGK